MTSSLRNSFTSSLQYLQNTCLVNAEDKLTTYSARRWQMWSKVLLFGVPVIMHVMQIHFPLHFQSIQLRETTIYTDIFDNVFIL